MRYSVFTIAALSAVIFISCNKLDYKKSKSGLVYKIYSDGKGQQVKEGDFIKFNIENRVNDSIYRTTFGKEPAYVQASNFGESYDISELWTKMRIGDSVIVYQSLDTFLKKGVQLPPEIKKGDRLIVTLKILDIFKTDSLAQLDQQKYMQARIDADMAKLAAQKESIKKYLADNKIEGCEETPSGAFVKIIEPGTGNTVDSGNYVSVKYTGKLMSTGVAFDSNIDSSFNHPTPLNFTVNVDQMAKGFTEGVRKLKKGSVAKIFIPAALGYGSAGRPPVIGPDQNLMFDIKVEDVQPKMTVQTTPMVTTDVSDSMRKKLEPKHH